MKPDIYVWKARRSPVLITVLPPVLALMSSFPETNWSLISSAFAFTGLLLLFGQVGRDCGYVKQDRLYSEWGGKPTTSMLRHRESPFDQVTLAYLHDWLSRKTGVQNPSKRKEIASPDAADQAYESFATFLREETRDKTRHPLVFEELVNYGFRRNLWGLRPYGIGMAIAGTAGAAVNLFRFSSGSAIGLALGSTLANLILLLFWLFWVNSNWVRIAAQAYANRLLGAGLQMARNDVKN